jgi:hypothetical protein
MKELRRRFQTLLDSWLLFAALLCFDWLLFVGGFRVFRRVVKSWPIWKRSQIDPEAASEIDFAVARIERYYLKRVRCLQRSAVIACVLRTRGIPAQVVVGCRRFPFLAHAWVEIGLQGVGRDAGARSFYSELDRW